MNLSFNISEQFFPYPIDMVSTAKLPFKKGLIFPGGTYGKDFKFKKHNSIYKPAPTRDQVFGKYKGWNGYNNHTWVFIKAVTDDLTTDSECIFKIPLLNHYSDVLKPELLAKYAQLNTIYTYTHLQQSNFSQGFKDCVIDVLEMFDALVNNRVNIIDVCLGNETYMHHDKGVERIRVYNKDVTDYLLTAHGLLCAMYVRLLKEKKPDIQFYFPLAEELTGGHRVWNSYFTNPTVMSALQLTGFDFHPYAKTGYTGTDISACYNMVYNQRVSYYNTMVKSLPMLNGGKIIHTEWSSSENHPILRNTMGDVLLFVLELKLQRLLPVKRSNWHAFSNGAMLGCALKMNGYTKTENIQLNAIGVAYKLFKHLTDADQIFVNSTNQPLPVIPGITAKYLQADSLKGFPVIKEGYLTELPAFSCGFYN